MSVLLSAIFLCAGLFAITAMLTSWRAHAPRIAGMRAELTSPSGARELRLSLREHVVVAVQSRRRRSVSRVKPIRHRAKSRASRREAA